MGGRTTINSKRRRIHALAVYHDFFSAVIITGVYLP
jgi:hypothetical protein